MSIDVRHGDCLDVLREMPDNSVDAVVTDPPYGLSPVSPGKMTETLAAWVNGDTGFIPKMKGYMGQAWDGFVPPPVVWAECMRVLKPGGHMAVFAGSRTVHIMGFALMFSGLEVRDTLAWIHGNGFPRSLDYGQQLEKLGHEGLGETYWDWRSELKPANEPIILARKPLSETSIARNIAEHGTGAINVGDCRYGDFQARRVLHHTGRALLQGAHSVDHLRQLAAAGKKTPSGDSAVKVLHRLETMEERVARTPVAKPGRWPANVVTGELVAEGLGDKAKFFFCPRIQKKDIPKTYADDGRLIQHQTVKPLALMEWLVTLITPPGGTVLDPFAGSGSTLEAARNKGFNSIGIEREADYIRLIGARLDHQRAS